MEEMRASRCGVVTQRYPMRMTSELSYRRLYSPSISREATINLECYRLNYQLATEINLSSLNSVPDAEVGLLRK